MRFTNTNHSLDAKFYESNVAYLGAPSEGKQGMSTDKQVFLVILSTDREHQHLTYVKLLKKEKGSCVNIDENFNRFVKMDISRILNTDGKTTFNVLKHRLTVKNQKIDYETDKKKLYFLNKIISNFKSKILDLYHGVGKRMLPLYFSEYEWRFNYRQSKNMLDKIFHHIQNS